MREKKGGEGLNLNDTLYKIVKSHSANARLKMMP